MAIDTTKDNPEEDELVENSEASVDAILPDSESDTEEKPAGDLGEAADETSEVSEEISASDDEPTENGQAVVEAEETTEETVTPEVFGTTTQTNYGLVETRDIITEMQDSYLDYAMSVIVSRALPDVRDGLKPSQRRILVAMNDLNLTHRAKHRKCAKIAGDTSGNYHPHGEQVIYPTLVHMAQDFSMRYPLVDGQGNFGSIDGDEAAAMRYTEARMSAITEEMLADLNKETVDWQWNYDNTRKEPKVLPAKAPQLIINGQIGIAVGMATNIPPHNLTEVCDGIITLIDNPEATVDDLMVHIKAPDFPTGANLYGLDQIKQAYSTGKGSVVMRAEATIEETQRGYRIIVTEIPYQVNKSTLITKIADLVKEKKLEGISDIRDESDRTEGVRIVIELRSNAYPKKILNKLFESTQMQTTFHVNMLALTPSYEPRVMNLKNILSYYIEHRREIVIRRTKYELKKAKERAHVLEGLLIALKSIDEVIETIKKSKDRSDANKNLVAKFKLSEIQANAILDMRLSQLAALERQAIEDEYQEKLRIIAELEDLLAHEEKILSVIKDELIELKEKHGDERRTRIHGEALGKFEATDLIPNEKVLITLTKTNYIKRLPEETYRSQIRGGKGVTGITVKDDDFVQHLCSASTHDDILFFTNKGRLFRTKVYEVPPTSRQAKGIALPNVIQIGQDEKVTAMLTFATVGQSKFLVMGTKGGVIKKTLLSAYQNVRKTGMVAIKLSGNDELRWVCPSSGKDYIFEATTQGQAILYSEEQVRPIGRSAAGVRGIKLRPGDEVIGLDVLEAEFLDKNPHILIVTQRGFGKRTQSSHYRNQNRGGYGAKTASVTKKTGIVITAQVVYGRDDDVLIMSKSGQTIRMNLGSVKSLGRDTQGVTLMRLNNDDEVASVTIVKKSDEKKDEEPPKPDKPAGPKLPEKIAKIEKVTEKSSKETANAAKEKPNTEKIKTKVAKSVEKPVEASKEDPKITKTSVPDKIVPVLEKKNQEKGDDRAEFVNKNIKINKYSEDVEMQPGDVNFWGGDLLKKKVSTSEFEKKDNEAFEPVTNIFKPTIKDITKDSKDKPT